MAILSKLLIGIGVMCAALCIATKMLTSWNDLLMEKGDQSNQLELPQRRFFTKLVKIPTKSIGTIIGRGGVGIRRLEFETQTFIRIIYCDKDGNPIIRNKSRSRMEDSLEEEWFSNEKSRRADKEEVAFVEIRGESEELVRIACLAIHGLVLDSLTLKITNHVTIDAHAIGAVIGKDGCNIRQMQRNYRVHMEIKNCGTSSMISITGEEESVALAKGRILQLMGRRFENTLKDEEDLSAEELVERVRMEMVNEDEDEDDWDN